MTAINQDVNPTSFYNKKKRIKMNEVSIIINGVRYDAVERDALDLCYGCDLYRDCKLADCCGDLIGLNQVFKKSDKKFEK